MGRTRGLLFLLAVAVLLAGAGVASAQDAPDPPEGPSPPPAPGDGNGAETVDDRGSECASTDNGSACRSHHRRGVRAGAAGAATVTVVSERERVWGAHDGSDGTTRNSWEDRETTRRAQAEVTAGPAPASAEVHVTNGSRTHRQGGDDAPRQGTDEERLEAGASVAVGGPVTAAASQGVGATARETFAGDGHHRCEAQVDGLPAVGGPCPSSLPGDSGLPPGPSLP